MPHSQLLLAVLLLSCVDEGDDTSHATDLTDSAATSAPDDADSAAHTGDDSATTEDTATDSVESRCLDTWSPGPTPPRNLLVISIDTLRRDYLGAYSAEATASPFIDSLLAEGLVLDDHRSCSNWTYASILCALSGRYNEDNGFFPRGGNPDPWDTQERTPLTPNTITLMPDLFTEQGFVSAIVTANPFLGTGFNVGSRYTNTRQITASAGEVTQAALESAANLRDDGRPWLLHAHYIDPHTPYTPPSEYVSHNLVGLERLPVDIRQTGGMEELAAIWVDLTAFQQALALEYIDVLYRGEIANLDHHIELLMTQLEEDGMLEDTLVMLWSDHGEQFHEHEQFQHHKALYSEETAGLAAFWSSDGDGPARWSGPTTHMDLLPTTLCMMGLEPLADVDPTSPTGAVIEHIPDNRPRFSSALLDISQSSVDLDGLRLIYRWDGTLELYDLAEDPGEQVDLAAERTEDVSALWSLLEPMVVKADSLHLDAEAVLP